MAGLRSMPHGCDPIERQGVDRRPRSRAAALPISAPPVPAKVRELPGAYANE